MFKNLFRREDTDVYLLSQSDFKSDYKLITESTYIMGAENPPIKMKNIADIVVEQAVNIPKKKILTAVTTHNVTYETNNPAFEKGLEEAELFSDIIPRIVIERNLRGEYIKVANTEKIKSNWQHWKEHTLPTAFPELSKQKKVITNFENGLKELDEEFNNNFQYTLLLPECYKYRDFYYPTDIGSLKKYQSHLVENLLIAYQLKKDTFQIEQDKVELHLKPVLLKSYQDRIEDRLKSFYKSYLPDFSYTQYAFDISLKYLLDKRTSRILNAEMSFNEELHPHLKYSMNFILQEGEKQKIN